MHFSCWYREISAVAFEVGLTNLLNRSILQAQTVPLSFQPLKGVDMTIVTKKGHYGVELLTPGQFWRFESSDGMEHCAGLLAGLTPYCDLMLNEGLLYHLSCNSHVLVATDLTDGHHGQVVGIVRLERGMDHHRRYGIVHDLIIEPSHRQNWIGLGLIEEVLQVAHLVGLPYVVLKVKPSRARALHVFKSAGFQEIPDESTSSAIRLWRRSGRLPHHRRQPVSSQ